MSLVCKWNECYEEYVNEKELFDHLEEHLSKIKFPKTQPCQWENCKFVTPTRFRLKTHLKSHVPYKNYECRFCSHASKVFLIYIAQVWTQQASSIAPFSKFKRL
eukprot:NODE_905_length_3200_cov_0.362786.p2 type:complete len:104 gc:universal NODE_905_length_3200_cov_0.362786:1203-892(-)